MEAILVCKQLHDVALGWMLRLAGPPNAVQAWDRKNQEARAELQLAIEWDQLAHMTAEDASEIWAELERVHRSTGFTTCIGLKRQLWKMKMKDGQRMASWISDVKGIVFQLSQIFHSHARLYPLRGFQPQLCHRTPPDRGDPPTRRIWKPGYDRSCVGCHTQSAEAIGPCAHHMLCMRQQGALPSKLPNPFAPDACSPAAPHRALQAREQAHYHHHHYRRRLAHGGRHGRRMVIRGCTHHASLAGVCWNRAHAAHYSATFSIVHYFLVAR